MDWSNHRISLTKTKLRTTLRDSFIHSWSPERVKHSVTDRLTESLVSSFKGISKNKTNANCKGQKSKECSKHWKEGSDYFEILKNNLGLVN